MFPRLRIRSNECQEFGSFFRRRDVPASKARTLRCGLFHRALQLEPLEDRCLLSVVVAPGPGFGAAGDSLTDEYWIDAASTWVELLAAEKGVNFGSQADWGSPRDYGYQYNWARAGATSTTLLAEGQHTGLAQQIDAGSVGYAVLAIGQNDLAPGTDAYQNIYSASWTQSQIDAFVDGVYDNIEAALATLTAAEGALVMANIIDYGLAPVTQLMYPSATSRGRVTTVVEGLNDRLEDLAFQYHTPLVDTFHLAQDFLGTGDSSTAAQQIGGVSLLIATGLDPHNVFVDGIHPHTIVQGALGNVFLEAFSLGYEFDVGSFQFTEQELLTAAGIGNEYVTDTLTLAYSDYVILPVSSEPIDLGIVDFRQIGGLDLSQGDLWYQLKTARAGQLTAIASAATGSAAVALYVSQTQPPLAVSDAASGRLDYSIQAGVTLLLKITGDSADAGLTIANLVTTAGTEIQVFGTDSADTFKFAPTGSYQITINGVEYDFDDTQYQAIDFSGGEGRDAAWLYDSSGNENLEAWPDRAVLANGAGDAEVDYIVEVSGIEDLLAYATKGGTDSAIFHGSESADKLKSYEDSVRLRAANSSYSLRVKVFDTFAGDAGTGGKDLAVFDGSEGDEAFHYRGTDNSAQVTAESRDHTAIGFDSITVRDGGGGTDVAWLTDLAAADDVFYFKSHKTKLVSTNVNLTVRAFDEVHATADQDGRDVARIYDTAGDEHLEVAGDRAALYRGTGTDDLLYEAIGFELVKAYSTEGNDTSEIGAHTFELLLDGWEE